MKTQRFKTTFYVICFSILLLVAAANHVAQAAENKAASNVVSQVAVMNPPKNYGVKVGDQLTRHIRFTVPVAYTLPKKSLPKKGSQHKGLELVELTIEESNRGNLKQYQVALVYQVFINPSAPSKMQLPALSIALTGGMAPATVAVPSWSFWFASLVVGNNDNASTALQADIRPPLLDAQMHKNRLIGLLALAGLSLLVLVYMNADGRWLPFMGGAFAHAHRQLKKLAKSSQAKTQKEEKQALVVVHQAFNQHYGANIFARDIEHFVTMRPSFAKMKAEINTFFDYSNRSLYDSKPRDSAKIILDLVQLSKALRDCERGV